MQVRVFEKPQPIFSFDRVCEDVETTFTDASTLNPLIGEQIVSWEWDMDYDGVTFSKEAALDNQQNFTYPLGFPGTHQVALRVTTDQGACSDILVQDVIVDPLPNANFTPDRTSGCSTLTITFTNNGVATQPDVVSEYIWEIDEGNGAGFVADSIQRPTDPNFTNLFTRDFINNGSADKDYIVRLRVVTVNGCERISNPVTITVFPGPRAGFVSLNYSPFNDNCSPLSVDFTVDSQTQALNPTDYEWTISDVNGVIDQISTGTTPTFNYNFINSTQTIRDFQIRLRATLPSACYGDSVRTIRVSPVPNSNFVIDTLAFECERIVLQMNAQQKGLSEYTWRIDIDGTTVYNTTGTNDILDYEFLRIASGNQNVQISLQTRNLVNCQSTVTTQNVVIPQLDDLNTSFTATPLNQTLPNSTVTINNTTNPGPWTYLWDFGDGTTSTDPNVGQHTYATYGTYTIMLRVTSNDCFEEQSVTVVINPIPPVLDFDYFPPSGCAPLTVNFTNLSQFADPSTYFWQFGSNQGTSRAVNPIYTYYEPGIYSVTLSATNALGDTVQITKQMIIEVYDRPSAQFNLKPRVIYIPGGKLFTDNQSFGATSYAWDFGDGGTSELFEPEHEYTQEGVFDVTLVATNSSGCADTAKMEAAVRVLKGGQVLIPNAFSPNLAGPGNTAGENDMFMPLMRGVVEFQMMIFNRWGELLFETKDQTMGWDGYYNGKLCQQDVYVYKLTAKFDNGEMITRVGDVNLIR